MPDVFPIVAFAIFAIIAIAAIIIGQIYASKRREALLQLAMRRGLDFSPYDPYHIDDIYDMFSCISQGHSREASNVLSGRVDKFDVKAFDYKYVTGSGKNRSTHHISVVMLDTTARFAALNIRTETILDRLAGAIGFDDINFESQEFSRKFHVSSNNKKFAYDVIHPRMMEFLLERNKWSIQMLGRSIAVHDNHTFSAEEFDEAITFAVDFLNNIPDYIWRQMTEPLGQ